MTFVRPASGRRRASSPSPRRSSRSRPAPPSARGSSSPASADRRSRVVVATPGTSRIPRQNAVIVLMVGIPRSRFVGGDFSVRRGTQEHTRPRRRNEQGPSQKGTGSEVLRGACPLLRGPHPCRSDRRRRVEGRDHLARAEAQRAAEAVAELGRRVDAEGVVDGRGEVGRAEGAWRRDRRRGGRTCRSPGRRRRRRRRRRPGRPPASGRGRARRRASAAWILGVRPNSPSMTTSVSSSRPRDREVVEQGRDRRGRAAGAGRP